MMLRINTTLFGILLMVLAGCASTQPARFYTLTPMSRSDAEARSETVDRDIALGIGPIRIPRYLDRPQIVTSNDQNEVKLAEFDRWAGSLKDSFARVLSENLSTLLSTDRVSLFPWRGSTPIDYQIEVEVIQFDGELAGNVSLIARWTIIDGSENKVLRMKKSNFTEPAGAQGYGALVAAQSKVLEDFSREIFLTFRTLSQRANDK